MRAKGGKVPADNCQFCRLTGAKWYLMLTKKKKMSTHLIVAKVSFCWGKKAFKLDLLKKQMIAGSARDLRRANDDVRVLDLAIH